MIRLIKNAASLFILFFTIIFFANNDVKGHALKRFEQNAFITAIPNENWLPINNSIKYARIKLSSAWDIETGNSNVLVGVIDTGIENSHPDFEYKINYNLSYDFVEQRSQSTDDYGHGTHVAGIIGANANNRVGTSGVCWNISLVSLRVCELQEINGKSEIVASEDKIAEAINYATIHNIPILNISLSSYGYSTTLENAIKNYPGLIICSVGNDGNDIDALPSYPACYDYDNILSVGASSDSDKIAILPNGKTSNYGENNVDLFAPGSTVYSTYPRECAEDKEFEDTYVYLSGTSMAAPFVTGVAALLLSQNPNLTAKHLKYRILNSVDRIEDLENLCVTNGRLNAYKALTFTHDHAYSNNPEYLNLNYHQYMCECGEGYRERHNWVSNKPSYLNSSTIAPLYVPIYTCSLCKKINMGPLPPDDL